MLEVIKYNEKSGIVVVNLLKSVQIMYLLSRLVQCVIVTFMDKDLPISCV